MIEKTKDAAAQESVFCFAATSEPTVFRAAAAPLAG
jgi:hypothetical protein